MSLCNFLKNSMKSLPVYRQKIQYSSHKETSVCTCQKASYTVEAAILFPLAAGFFVSILFLFQILQVQISVEQALIYAGEKTALESSAVTSESALLLSAKAYFISALKECAISEKEVTGGIWGISLRNLNVSEKELTLEAAYWMKFPVGFFGKRYFSITQKNMFRKWNGACPESGGKEEESETYVYITESGNAYHQTTECRSLSLTIQQTSIDEITTFRGYDGQKYYPCSLCSKTTNEKQVYYTNYGYLYHMDIRCSALKRTIYKILITEIGNRTPCKYCCGKVK